jgi:hypothetical protein
MLQPGSGDVGCEAVMRVDGIWPWKLLNRSLNERGMLRYRLRKHGTGRLA